MKYIELRAVCFIYLSIFFIVYHYPTPLSFPISVKFRKDYARLKFSSRGDCEKESSDWRSVTDRMNAQRNH